MTQPDIGGKDMLSIFVVPDLRHVDAVLPPRLEAGTVWHYTDAAGLLGIVDDDSMRASAIWAMNDRAEFTYGVDLIRAELDGRSGELEHEEDVGLLVTRALASLRKENHFVACASTAENSLSQWRAYGGYAIGIDTGTRLQVRTVDRDPSPLGVWTPELGAAQLATEVGWRAVVYAPKAQRDMIARLLNELDRLAPSYKADWSDESQTAYRVCMSLVAHTIPYLKHPAFEEEREVRLFVNYDIASPGVRLRAGRLGITSFVDVEARQALLRDAEDSPHAPYRVPRFPIQRIQIGPGISDHDVAKQGVEVALQLHRLERPVELVDSPLR